jgi:adenylate cyclase
VTDMRTTALGELVPGIEIQAQVIETIFERSFLRRPTWLKWAESAFIMAFGLLIIWYVPRTDSRLAVFISTVPKGSTILGLLLNLLILSSGFLFFRYLGLLVDAASIFIILSAVMGCFFSTALLHDDAQQEAARAQVREDDNSRTGTRPGPEVV